MNLLNIMFRILCILIGVEIFVMLLFSLYGVPDTLWRNIADALLLALFSAPFLYQLVFKPLKRHHRMESDMRQLHVVVRMLSNTMRKRDSSVSQHDSAVTTLARSIAQGMGLDDDQVEGIRIAGTLHDIGNIWLPARILAKPGTLNTEEFELVKQHTHYSLDILKDIVFPWPVAEDVYQHHERMDGSGYPLGLKGDQINVGARIIAVADTVCAMNAHRPYRPAFSMEEILETLEKQRGKKFDATVVDACLKLFDSGFSLDDASLR
ncbi:HD-GYP domain-containing protein [Mariprofundus sp. NF]|uniref:HD-GYP domain-containing protein n=1 Tax=Mariprofundus sp. NF TaxID=2608716 RepID=UPI0015A10CC7|nr:HD-GYP domain-containing protein [Mariprofundus sp. NF]NWF37621.1 HD-GYP domain-containing protein [Mariprofundus sp. NF]